MESSIVSLVEGVRWNDGLNMNRIPFFYFTPPIRVNPAKYESNTIFLYSLRLFNMQVRTSRINPTLTLSVYIVYMMCSG